MYKGTGVGWLLVKGSGGGFICRMCFSKVAKRPAQVARCSGLNTAAKQVSRCGTANKHDWWAGRILGGSTRGPPVFCCKDGGA